jgi:hypothetical protein
MGQHCARFLAVVVAALTIAGCASTTMQSTWRDPAYTGGAFRKVLVLGQFARDVTARRVLEDTLAARIRAAGTDAVPGWQYLPSEGPVDEAGFNAAVAASGADGILMVRLLGVDTQMQVSPMLVPGPGPAWYGYYSRWYAVPQVTQYQIAVVETTLLDVKTRRIVWAGTSETFNPTSVQKDAPGYADLIARTLQQGGFLPAAR